MIRAHVDRDPCSFGVRLSIVNQHGDDAYPAEIFHVIGGENGRPDFKWEPLSPGALVEPTLAIPDDMGRALLDALTRHYSGTEDTRALRRDYDAERKRVDRLIDSVSGLADKLAAPAVELPEVRIGRSEPFPGSAFV